VRELEKKDRGGKKGKEKKGREERGENKKRNWGKGGGVS